LQFEKNALTIKLKEFEEKSKSDIIILDKFKEENIKKEKKKKF